MSRGYPLRIMAWLVCATFLLITSTRAWAVTRYKKLPFLSYCWQLRRLRRHLLMSRNGSSLVRRDWQINASLIWISGMTDFFFMATNHFCRCRLLLLQECCLLVRFYRKFLLVTPLC